MHVVSYLCAWQAISVGYGQIWSILVVEECVCVHISMVFLQRIRMICWYRHFYVICPWVFWIADTPAIWVRQSVCARVNKSACQSAQFVRTCRLLDGWGIMWWWCRKLKNIDVDLGLACVCCVCVHCILLVESHISKRWMLWWPLSALDKLNKFELFAYILNGDFLCSCPPSWPPECLLHDYTELDYCTSRYNFLL